jgi:ribonuclease-3
LPPARRSWWSWLTGLFSRPAARPSRRPRVEAGETLGQQEARSIAEFSQHFRIHFHDPELLRLALTHRSYLSVTGMGPRESNERLEFLGDSVLGLVTSEYLYRRHPNEHEGQLTKTKSLLVSKAILSRRAYEIGLGRFLLLSHSEMESGGRRRASILCDAFESVLGAIYLDQGFEPARRFVEDYLLRGAREIVADKRHRNYKSQLQEYVQSTFHTHPVYRIRSQMGPDHSKLFLVEVMVGRRVLGQGRGSNKKEAEQAAARDAMEQVAEPGARRGEVRAPREPREPRAEAALPRAEAAPARAEAAVAESEPEERQDRRARGRRRSRPDAAAGEVSPVAAPAPPAGWEKAEEEVEPRPSVLEEDDIEEVGRPEGPLDDGRSGRFEGLPPEEAAVEPPGEDRAWDEEPAFEEEDLDEEPVPGEEPVEEAPYDEESPAPEDDGEPEEQPDVRPAPSGPPAASQFGRKRQRRR